MHWTYLLKYFPWFLTLLSSSVDLDAPWELWNPLNKAVLSFHGSGGHSEQNQANFHWLRVWQIVLISNTEHSKDKSRPWLGFHKIISAAVFVLGVIWGNSPVIKGIDSISIDPVGMKNSESSGKLAWLECLGRWHIKSYWLWRLPKHTRKANIQATAS